MERTGKPGREAQQEPYEEFEPKSSSSATVLRSIGRCPGPWGRSKEPPRLANVQRTGPENRVLNLISAGIAGEQALVL
jgi:hypothetical protein